MPPAPPPPAPPAKPAVARRSRAGAPARIERTVATVLRIHPFSNTSQMVVWLAADGRRLVTSVKGAARPKSAFLGRYDLFHTLCFCNTSLSRTGIKAVFNKYLSARL